jgi:hypothetical protein
MTPPFKSLAGAGLLLCAALAAGGCAAVGVWPVPATHELPPETRVVPIGAVKGYAKDWFFTFGGVPDIMHPDIAQAATKDALAAKQADLLTNATYSLYVTRIPLGLYIAGVNAWIISWTVEGTAAKFEPMPPAQPSPPTPEPPHGP